jgi:hypothetical protein
MERLLRLILTACAVYDKVHVDFLVHATPSASGSLIRLLRSLKAADYTASAIPHLTIELPHEIDSPTKEFLESFSWPPAHFNNPTNDRHLTLRHRIPNHRLTEEESSARFLESFWPAHPNRTHVLVLSPQVELSPDFFHCKIAHFSMARWSINFRIRRPKVFPAVLSLLRGGRNSAVGEPTIRHQPRTATPAARRPQRIDTPHQPHRHEDRHHHALPMAGPMQ